MSAGFQFKHRNKNQHNIKPQANMTCYKNKVANIADKITKYGIKKFRAVSAVLHSKHGIDNTTTTTCCGLFNFRFIL